MAANVDISTLEWFINGKMKYLIRSLSSAYLEFTTEKAARELLASVVEMMGDYLDLGHQTQNLGVIRKAEILSKHVEGLQQKINETFFMKIFFGGGCQKIITFYNSFFYLFC